MESAGFMNALTSAASAAPVVRKRKRVSAAKVFVYVLLGLLLLYDDTLFIYLFYFIITFLQTGTTTTTTATSSVSNTKVGGGSLLMLLRACDYFSVVLLLHSLLMANVLLQKLSTVPSTNSFWFEPFNPPKNSWLVLFVPPFCSILHHFPDVNNLFYLLNKAAYICVRCKLFLLTSQNHVNTVVSFLQ